ncbi:MAG: hypothetical protein ACXWIU_01770 [Limisphaerales bacterium]
MSVRRLAAKMSRIWSLLVLLATALHCCAQTMTSSGLRATFVAADGKTTDTKMTPTLAVYVPEGESPTSFLPGGKFHVTWSGFIRADLRDEMSFQAEVNGTFKLEIGGVTVLEAANTKGPTAFSEPVRLKKGLNILRATFGSPITGDAFVRVQVKTSEGLVQSLDPTHLDCADSSESRRADAMRDGFTSFLEHRCARCHDVGISNGTPDLNMDAPALDGIGSRLRGDWIARWVADPRSIRPDAHMPQIRIASRPENARAIAAFLASTGTNISEPVQPRLTSVEIKKAQAMFESQHCDVCHYTEGAGTPDTKKVSLANIAAKFYPDALRAYIEKPDAFYKWTAMPRFRFGPGDADLMARWLIARSLSFSSNNIPATKGEIEHGKELVQSLGCLNCHAMSLPNKFSTMPLARADMAHGGCIGSQPTIDFGFAPIDRSAIHLWFSNERTSLTRNVPMEFAQRHYARLLCAECHQKVEGVPAHDRIGEKLKPEWMGRFIAGDIAQKPRPWLSSQMPAFPEYGVGVAQGLAERNGFAPHSPTNTPVAELARIGSQLVQAPPVGLACVQCHATGATMPTISDAPGINFAFIAERLQPSYFQRWVRKPSAIDPHTKMPSFFTDEGTSPLKQYFNGNADMQIAAIWEYLQTRHE